jgi:hypothetical protein
LQWAFCVIAVCMHCAGSMHSVGILWALSVHSVCGQCAGSGHSVGILWVDSVYSVYIQCAFCGHPMGILWAFCGQAVCIQCAGGHSVCFLSCEGFLLPSGHLVLSVARSAALQIPAGLCFSLIPVSTTSCCASCPCRS